MQVFDLFLLFQLRDFTNLRPTVSQVDMEIIIHAFISFHPDYCSSLVICLSNTSMDRLQMGQVAAAKLIQIHQILMFTFRACHHHIEICCTLMSPAGA